MASRVQLSASARKKAAWWPKFLVSIYFMIGLMYTKVKQKWVRIKKKYNIRLKDLFKTAITVCQ